MPVQTLDLVALMISKQFVRLGKPGYEESY
jgi:hypothetical protein